MDDKLVTVATFFNASEAYITKGLLESEGIDAWLYDEHTSTVYTPLIVGGVRLAVRQSDLEKAREILSDG